MKGKRAALERRRNRDSQLHRCGYCGDWLYAKQPCVTCAVLLSQHRGRMGA